MAAASRLVNSPEPAAVTLVQPSPTPSVVRAPPAGPLETVGALFAIVFALAAGIMGYRIIRGGRGL